MDAFKKLFKQPPFPKPRNWYCSSCSRGFFQKNQAANHLRQSSNCLPNYGMIYNKSRTIVESVFVVPENKLDELYDEDL